MTSQEVRGHGEEAVVEHCGGEQKWLDRQPSPELRRKASELLRGTRPTSVDSPSRGHDGAVVIETLGRGGAVATRAVLPECSDASSECIEGPAQLSLWGGADTTIGRKDCVRPSIRAGEAPTLLRVIGLCGPSTLNCYAQTCVTIRPAAGGTSGVTVPSGCGRPPLGRELGIL